LPPNKKPRPSLKNQQADHSDFGSELNSLASEDPKFNRILTNLFSDLKESMTDLVLNTTSERELLTFTKQNPDKKTKDSEQSGAVLAELTEIQELFWPDSTLTSHPELLVPLLESCYSLKELDRKIFKFTYFYLYILMNIRYY
jgi:hypothetical protein